MKNLLDKIEVPEVLFRSLTNESLVGFYKLENKLNWLQPYEIEEVDWDQFNQDFDGKTTTSQGLLVGAIRICNTGCEGYHIYVYLGKDKGTIWSDQREPFGRLTKISDDIDEYIENIRSLGRGHISHYEDFS